MARQILEIFGATLERNAEMGRKCVQVTAASPWHHNAIDSSQTGKPAANHIRGHQTRDLQGQRQHGMPEWRRLHGFDDAMQVFFGKPAGQEEDVLRQFNLWSSVVPSSSTESTTVVCSNFASLFTFSRSIGRG